jgi:hypothetical protein
MCHPGGTVRSRGTRRTHKRRYGQHPDARAAELAALQVLRAVEAVPEVGDIDVDLVWNTLGDGVDLGVDTREENGEDEQGQVIHMILKNNHVISIEYHTILFTY